MAVIFLFIDGVGLGEKTAANPFWVDDYPAFNSLAGDQSFTRNADFIDGQNHLFKAVDATLDVGGLPQSGTGQAALFTGKNTAKKIGKHFGPFPHSGVKPLLRKQSLFHQAKSANKSCHFINAYPEIFFQKSEARNRWSCTTLMTKSANLRLNTTKDIMKGTAITAGITQKAWREHLSLDVPEIPEEEAARRLLQKAKNVDLVLYEYYLSDKAGHSKQEEQAHRILKSYNRFLYELICEKNSSDTLVLCSDHGNVEDLSIKTHTINQVPLAALGPGASVLSKATTIMDVTPAILEVLS